MKSEKRKIEACPQCLKYKQYWINEVCSACAKRNELFGGVKVIAEAPRFEYRKPLWERIDDNGMAILIAFWIFWACVLYFGNNHDPEIHVLEQSVQN